MNLEHFFAGAEFKFVGNDQEMMFRGHGAVFGNVDRGGDLILPGAFADTIAEAKRSGDWPAMISQHGMTADGDVPIGIWTDLGEDSKGLDSQGVLADTLRGREYYVLMKMKPRPAVNKLSIGYQAVEFAMRSKPDEPRRTLKRVKLYEISPVTFPMNPKAAIQQVKSGLNIRDAERALCDAGFSRSEAKAIVAEGFKAGLRDAMPALDEIAASLEAALRNNINIIQPS